MKIVYIAHPIAGDVWGNIKKILAIVREINLTEPEITPLVPYLADVMALDDTNPIERERGRKNGLALLLGGRVDELWCFGGTISPGMEAEIDAAEKAGIPVCIKGILVNILDADDNPLQIQDVMLGLMLSNVPTN
jgi:hypothetical protein